MMRSTSITKRRADSITMRKADRSQFRGRILPLCGIFRHRNCPERTAFDHLDEAGTATVEMAVLGSLIFGVLVHVIVLFGVIQRSMLAASAAAREVGRVVVLADTQPEAEQRAGRVLAQVAVNHGLAVSDFDVALSGALVRGEKLRVTVRTSAPVASLPFIGSVWPTLSVPIEAVYVGRVDKFRSFDR